MNKMAKNEKAKTIQRDKHDYDAWEQDAERLILYADVMGFKSRVMTKKHEVLKKEFLDFRKAWDTRVKPLKLNDFLKFVQFSDSMMIIVQGTDWKMFNLLTKASIALMQIAMEKKFPIKGAVAQGIFGFYADKQLYFGQPLCDAAILHDQLKFYGIAVHHSAEKTVKMYASEQLPYSKTPIFIDKGRVCHYHLCWNLQDKTYQSKDITERCKQWLRLIEESVSGEPRMYVDRTEEVLDNDSKEYQERQKNKNVDDSEA